MFQFPFHRDRLCNEAEGITIGEIQAGFQFPFHRDRLCNTQNMLAGAWVTLTRFNSLFIGIGSAIADQRFCQPGLQKGFNSLFIGIGSAIGSYGMDALTKMVFQFPFHRDRLCNHIINPELVLCPPGFQFPFHRDRLCNALAAPRTMAKKMAVFQFPFHRDRLCNVAADRISDHLRIMSFNSLFIGIGSAISCISMRAVRRSSCFNSLFIGIGSAIYSLGTSHTLRTLQVSIPFSSG